MNETKMDICALRDIVAFCSLFREAKTNLVVQDNTQEGIVDVDLAVVCDEAQFLEFVHEQIDPGPRCADDLRQHFL